MSPPVLLGIKSLIFISFFRVVSGEEYLHSFASDRSHMLSPAADSSIDSEYISPPPPYPIICGPLAAAHGFTNNLMTHFLMDREAFVSWLLTSVIIDS
ncbi:hypothetical protein F4604DRAFT_1705538 [Suillus subluteus]|nr:hypothetical protein F4604DRAFT_1705538 [Suillus subluteus]